MLFTNGGLLHGLLRSLWHPQILFLYLMYHSHRALPKMQIWPCHFSQTIFGFPLTPVMCPNWSLQPHLSTLSSSPCKLLWNAVCSLTTSAFAPAVPFPERSHHIPSHLTESSPTFPDVLSFHITPSRKSSLTASKERERYLWCVLPQCLALTPTLRLVILYQYCLYNFSAFSRLWISCSLWHSQCQVKYLSS